MKKIDASDKKIRKMIRIALVEQHKSKKNKVIKNVSDELESIRARVKNGQPVDSKILDSMEKSLNSVGIKTTDISAAIGEDPKTQHSYLFTNNSPGNQGGALKGLKDMVSGMVDDISEVDDYVNEISKKLKRELK